MLTSPALRRLPTIMSRISRGMTTKRDTLVSEATEVHLFLENTATAVSDSLRFLFPSALPVMDLDWFNTPDTGVYENFIGCFLFQSCFPLVSGVDCLRKD